MHELTLVQAVVRTVIAAMPEPGAQVSAVRLRVGAFSGLTEEGLRFAYDVAAAGTPLAGSELIVEAAPLSIECPSCGRQELGDGEPLRCPSCGAPGGAVVGDDGLQIVDITLAPVEGVDAATEH